MDQIRGQKRNVISALLFILAIIAILLVLYETRFGPGVGGDSVRYIMGSQNLLAGNGYSRTSGGGEIIPITGFPPIYSATLALVGLTKVDPYAAARVLNALLFGFNTFLAGIIILRFTRSAGAALIGSTLFLTSTTLVLFHGMVMSEPLFIFLMLIVIYGLAEFLDNNNRALLFFIGAITGLAILTRYVGASLTFAGVATILLLGRTHWTRRVLDALFFAGISIAPLYFWLRRNASQGGSLINRAVSFHLMRPEVLRGYLAEVASWFMPRILGLPRPLRNVLVILLATPVPAVYALREFRDRIARKVEPRAPFWALPWILFFFVLGFAGILAVNSLFLDAATTQSAPPRYLTPVLVAVILFLVSTGSQLLKDLKLRQWPKAAVAGYAGFLIILFSAQSLDLVRNPQIAYTGFMRQRQSVVEVLEALDPEAPIITNNPEMVYLMANRPAYMWPIAFDSYTLEERADYDAQLEGTREKLHQGGVLVVFGWPLGTEELVFDVLEAERLETFIDVHFFGYQTAESDQDSTEGGG